MGVQAVLIRPVRVRSAVEEFWTLHLRWDQREAYGGCGRVVIAPGLSPGSGRISGSNPDARIQDCGRVVKAADSSSDVERRAVPVL